MKIKSFLIFLISFNFLLKAQTSYTDSILDLKNKIEDKAFVESVIRIPYDEAVKDIAVFKKLTDIAIEKSNQINDSSLLAKSYLAKTYALHFTSQNEKDIEYNLKAISIFESLGDTKNAAKAYLNLGWKIKNRKLKDAFFYMQKGLKSLERINEKFDLIGAYNNFGVLNQMKNELDSALYFHRKSLKLAKAFKDSIGIPFAHTHIAEVLTKKNSFDNAKKHLDSSLVIRLKRNDTYGITDSYLYLGDLFYSKKEYNKAIINYQLGYTYSNEHGYFPLKKYAAEYLYKSYEKIGDFEKSLVNLKLFQDLKDSVLNKETNTKIEELQIEFETAKKEKVLAEQELEIKNKNLITLILVGSILLISILFWSNYKRAKFKRSQLKKEMELKEALAAIKTQNKLQNQRLEISRDLHDNIGSQLTFIISSIDNLKFVSKDLSAKFQKKLSGISGFTSDTIHQLRDTIWAMNKNEISFDDLQTRLLSYVEKAKIASKNTKFSIESKPIDYTFGSVEGMHLFRVIQEAINNSIKYANASKIDIEFINNDDLLTINYSDNGIGFNKKEVTDGNGLANMEIRVEQIGGTLIIDSEKGNGTSIVIQLKKS